MNYFTIDLNAIAALTDDQFDTLCANNPDIKFERTPNRELVIMAPTSGETGICPDFVLELRSPSDNPKTIRAKMQEYLSCGTKLDWMLNLEDLQAEICRPNQPVEVLMQCHSLVLG